MGKGSKTYVPVNGHYRKARVVSDHLCDSDVINFVMFWGFCWDSTSILCCDAGVPEICDRLLENMHHHHVCIVCRLVCICFGNE
jgi:hypothetical protein